MGLKKDRIYPTPEDRLKRIRKCEAEIRSHVAELVRLSIVEDQTDISTELCSESITLFSQQRLLGDVIELFIERLKPVEEDENTDPTRPQTTAIDRHPYLPRAEPDF